MSMNRTRLNGLQPADQALLDQVHQQHAEQATVRPRKAVRQAPPSAAEVLAGIMDALHVPRDTPWDELPHLVALRCRPLCRARLYNLVHGGLLMCANDIHGPIGPRHFHDAAKRITYALHAFLTAKTTGEEHHD